MFLKNKDAWQNKAVIKDEQLCLKSVKTDLGLVWLVLRTNSMLFCEHTVYSFLGTWIRGENYMLLTFLR